MKTLFLTTIAMLATFAVPALAETPNRVTLSFEEYLNASGCVLVDKGGYQNIAAADGGGCSPDIVANYSGGYGTRPTPGRDGILGTADDGEVTDR